MPLKKGTSSKTVSGNIREFLKGPRSAKTQAKSGRARAVKQAVAVALREKRRSARTKARRSRQ